MFSWHVFQRIFKYPSSGLRIGIIVIQGKSNRSVEKQIINCHRGIVRNQGIRTVDKLIQLQAIVFQILIFQVNNVCQHIFSKVIWNLEIMLLNYHKYMIITTEIIKSKKPLLIVQDRNIKFIVQRFLIQSLAACMTVGRHPQDQPVTVSCFQKLFLICSCGVASLHHLIVTGIAKCKKLPGTAAKELFLRLNKHISWHQTVVEKYLAVVLVRLVAAAMPEIYKSLTLSCHSDPIKRLGVENKG